MSRRLLALALAALLLVSPFALAGTSLGAATPDDHADVPTSNIDPPSPDPGDPGIPDGVPTVAEQWDVSATHHAGDLDISLGYDSSGTFVLTATDDVNSIGRQVALNATALEHAVGYKPQTAYGVHDSGERWDSPISYQNNLAVIDVPHFSTNEITFNGTISITATDANDGAQWTYEVNNLDATDTYNITATGIENTHSETESITKGSDGDTLSLSVAGNADPTGPSNNNPEITVTGIKETSPSGSSLSEFAFNVSAGRAAMAAGPNDRIYAGGFNNQSVAKITENGEVLWSRSTADSVNSVTAGSEDIYVAVDNGSVIRLNSDGSHEWVSSHGGDASNSIAVTSSDVYVTDGTSGDDGVYKLSKSDGTQSTSFTADNNGYRISANESGWWVVSQDSSTPKVAVYDSTDTQQFTIPAPQGQGVEFVGEYVYLSASNGGDVLRKVHGESNNTVWENSSISPGTINGEHGGLVVNGGSSMFKVDYDSEVIWENDSIDYSTAEKAVTSNGLVATSTFTDDGYVRGFNQTNQTQDPVVDIDGDTHLTHSGSLSDGQTITAEVGNLTTSASQLQLYLGSGNADVDLDYTERTQTQDPSVETNGKWANHSGTVKSGDTVSPSTNTSWIQEGKNRVNLSLSDDSLAADAPTMAVDLDYSHDAEHNQSIDYNNKQWSETYNVSKKFTHSRQNAELSIPFDNNNVVSVRVLEKRINGSGSWSSVSNENHSLSGTTLTVDLGDVKDDEKVEIKANGSKVSVSDGSITVLEATGLGNDLNTKIQIDSRNPNFEIDVSQTSKSDRVHYISDETWSDNSDPHAVINTTQEQSLHLPNAGVDGSARVKTLGVEIIPSGGSAEIGVVDPSQSKFRVRDATAADEINVTYHDTTSGETYALKDSSGDVINTQTAESPVSYLIGGSTETYFIELHDGSGGSETGVSVVGEDDSSQTAGPLSAFIVLLVVAGSMIAFLFVGNRLGISSGRRDLLLLGGGGIVGFLGLEFITSGSLVAFIVDRVASVIEGAVSGAGQSSAFTLIIGLGIVLGLWLLERRTRISIPRWIWVIVIAGVSIFVLDGITGGSLSSGLGEVSPLLWLVGIGGALILAYRALRPSRPTIEIGGDQQ